MKDMYISNEIIYIGADDNTIDLFESQYRVPDGISYNSYLILDDKITVMDTVDPHYTDQWLENIRGALQGNVPDYLVVQHMEPDHSGSIRRFLEEYPNTVLIGNKKTFPMIKQFYDLSLPSEQIHTVEEGETLCLGRHTLQFFMAPLVHWPEVMVTYEQSEKLLFSADAFGTFGALSADIDWISEARRYYFNIVGKYGAQVQSLLKKTAGLEITMICPLHGPVLKDNLSFYIGKYQIWSSYRPEEAGVTIAYASAHGNTAAAAKRFAEILTDRGMNNVALYDLNRDDLSAAVESAFRYDKLILASVTYDGSLFPAMEDFLYHLKIKNYQARTVGFIQNGSWGPTAAKFMKEYITGMKNMTEAGPIITIKSSLTETNIKEMESLADSLLSGK